MDNKREENRWPTLRVTLEHLKLVRTILACGNVTHAASALRLSQSAASHKLIALERRLGAALFERVGKKMIATPLAERFAQSAEAILAELTSLESDVKKLQGIQNTSLRISTSCYTSYGWLPEVLTRLASRHPHIEVSVNYAAGPRVLDALQQNEIDLAITTEKRRQPGIVQTEVFAEQLVCLMSRRHPLRGKRSAGIAWSQLSGETVLVHDMSEHDEAGLRQLIGSSRPGGPRAVQIRRAPLTEGIVALARAGLGVGVLGDGSIKPFRKDAALAVVPITPPVRRRFYACWRATDERRYPFDELVQALRAIE